MSATECQAEYRMSTAECQVEYRLPTAGCQTDTRMYMAEDVRVNNVSKVTEIGKYWENVFLRGK